MDRVVQMRAAYSGVRCADDGGNQIELRGFNHDREATCGRDGCASAMCRALFDAQRLTEFTAEYHS